MLILGTRRNCSSDESDSQSDDEVPDQAPYRSASKKVLLALAFCGSSAVASAALAEHAIPTGFP